MPQVIYYVAYCIMIIAYVITATLAIKRKKPTKSEVVEPTTERVSAFEALALKAIDYVHNVEVNFSDLFREGAKAGAFKLDKFLDYMKKSCEDLGMIFDQAYWTSYADKAVKKLLNFNKADCQSTDSTVKVDISTIGIKTYGGNK